MTIGYFTVYQMLSGFHYETKLMGMLGFAIGYIIYDMTHYALHHFETTGDSYFKRLQRYHNMHHYSGQEAAYGVSSKFWDIVFGTQLK